MTGATLLRMGALAEPKGRAVLTAHTVTNTRNDPLAATAGIGFNRDGELLQLTASLITSPFAGEWWSLEPETDIGVGWDMRWDNVTGAPSAGSPATGVWLSMPVTDSIWRFQQAVVGSTTITGTLSVRDPDLNITAALQTLTATVNP